MSEDFLVRWSRRKNEARRAGRGSTPEPDRSAELTRDAQPGAVAGESAITPEELAALPSLDELTAETDIAGFLRGGVPVALRNAALRKMWMLDPAIRDFVGHARDYDYDWNAPGGAPGSGPVDPEHVAAMLRCVFARSEAAREGQSGTEPAENGGSASCPAVAGEHARRGDGKPASNGSDSDAHSPSEQRGTATDA